MPSWLRWVLGILGVLLVLGALYPLGLTVRAFWLLSHSKAGLMAKSGQLLAKILGQFVGEIVLMMLGGWVISKAFKKKAAAAAAATEVAKAPAAPLASAQPVKRYSRKRWHSANVLQLGVGFHKLWGFSSSKRGFTLSQEHNLAESDTLPVKQVAKDWKSLFQPRFNVAWLPAEHVFLRVVQLPVADFDETLQMVEFQLEKLSPLPVTQICWSIHILPHRVDNLQTIIITIVARDLVQEYLGRLEGQGYLPDRLEMPMVDQLQATPITGDGAWLYPGPEAGKFIALVAWWYGGVLRNLALLNVPSGENRSALFQEQINQMTWAGEMEGWLGSSPQWHLVADEATAANWLPMFQSAVGQKPEIIQPLADSAVAAMTANRATQANPKSNILPTEYSERYHQQFVDGLWMRGVGAVIVGYLAMVMVYMAIASWKGMQADNMDQQMHNLSGQYTNVLKLKDKVQILQDRQDLKNAALDAWKITAELLPEGLTIQSLELKNGKSFSVFGSAPRDADNTVNDFNDAMRKATINGRPFFASMEVALTHVNGNNLSWSFNGELARAGGEGSK